MQTFVNRDTKVIVHLQERSMKQLERIGGRWNSLQRSLINHKIKIATPLSVKDLELPPAMLRFVICQPTNTALPKASTHYCTDATGLRQMFPIGGIDTFVLPSSARRKPLVLSPAYFVVSRGDATAMQKIGYLQVHSRYKSHLAANAQGDNIPQIPQSLLASVNLSKKSQKISKMFQIAFAVLTLAVISSSGKRLAFMTGAHSLSIVMICTVIS